MAEGAAVRYLLRNLADPMLKRALKLYHVSDEVEHIQHELASIKALLEDADSKHKNNKFVKEWMNQVRDIAYRMEDAIDTFLVDIKENSQKTESSMLNKLKMAGKKPIKMYNLTDELKAIKKNLNEIFQLHSNLRNMNPDAGGHENRADGSELKKDENSHLIIRHTLLADDSDVVGLEADKDNIIKQLLDENIRSRMVLSIVGPGGIGKTTLAQKIYKSEKLKNRFACFTWLPISQKFNSNDLLKKILNSIKPEMKDKNLQVTDENLSVELKSSLSGKRYLIILDDVWTNDLWEQMKISLPDSKNGSRVIITTRLLDVAKEADCNTQPYELHYLNDDDGQALLFRRAFQKPMQRDEYPTELVEVAKKLTKKCGGLPLALIVLGRILTKRSNIFYAWNNVEQTMNWHNGDGEKCMKILAMSYLDLPYNLKPCFLYFASFPQDYKISANHVTKMWVAEGFIPEDEVETMEESAEKLLQVLVQRCLIEVIEKSWNDNCKYCKLHNLLLDLAIYKAKEEKFFTVFSKAEDINLLVARKPRRAALQFCTPTKNDVYSKKTRSLLCFGFELPNYSRFRLLRVLTIEGVDMKNFNCGQSQKSLPHLRYLGLRYSSIRQEIFKVISLYKLETIDLKGSTILSPIVKDRSDVEIPTLKHVHGCKEFKVIFPLKWELHTNLQTLKGVEQGEVPRLGSCTNLRTLGILYHYVTPADNDFRPQREDWETLKGVLEGTKQLVSLRIIVAREKGCSYSLPFRGTKDFTCHEKIQSLHLTGQWVRNMCVPSVDIFPTNLTKLVLESTGFNEDPMPIFAELHSLRILRLGPSSYNGTKLSCPTKGFGNLIKLELRELPMLSHLDIKEGAMPKLRHLKIIKCDELHTLPKLEVRILQRESITNGYILEPVNGPLREQEQPARRPSLIFDCQHFTVFFIVFVLVLIIAPISRAI